MFNVWIIVNEVNKKPRIKIEMDTCEETKMRDELLRDRAHCSGVGYVHISRYHREYLWICRKKQVVLRTQPLPIGVLLVFTSD